MRRAGKLVGTAAGAAAGAAAVGAVARQQRTIARRGAGETTPFGELRSTPLQIVADDGTDLHAEIDEPGDHGGTPATEDDLTVVFVHGYTLNLDCWHFQRAAYRGRVRTVFYDQRSHGRSARSEGDGSTIEQLGLDLMRVIQHTAPGPVVLVGHSMGGMSIISLAEHHPELFGDKVVGAALVSTTAGGLDPGRILFPMLPLGMGGRFVGRAVRTLSRGHKLVDLAREWGQKIADVVTDRYAFGDDVPIDYVDFVFDMINATPFSVVADFYPAFASLAKFEVLSPLAQAPTAIICGTEDRITPISHSRKLHARIAGSSLLECQGAGHMVILERHDEVNRELDDLLDLAHQRVAQQRAPQRSQRKTGA
ncbi:alpha/beta hydrolase [Nocardioides seonyuensis]|uniref:Alpha/beta hydrolase n=1 Tax=Nocardioides seonyuensis TaxID=2518371 RepID=A0A4P7IC55_9ACTN|nr:alpha/beta hydrolase [Nocardioides seonyuensis]QBX54678.1 alpha/beta hydrolase [Nocardioides seonyuensis]